MSTKKKFMEEQLEITEEILGPMHMQRRAKDQKCGIE